MSTANLIEELIKTKRELQKVYFELQIKNEENNSLKKEIEEMKAKKNVKEEEKRLSESAIILRENRSLLAQVRQMKRDSIASPVIVKKKSLPRCSVDQQFEVDKLLAHRGKKGDREFKVRWKKFGAEHDSWKKASSLRCPLLLNSYLRKKNLYCNISQSKKQGKMALNHFYCRIKKMEYR